MRIHPDYMVCSFFLAHTQFGPARATHGAGELFIVRLCRDVRRRRRRLAMMMSVIVWLFGRAIHSTRRKNQRNENDDIIIPDDRSCVSSNSNNSRKQQKTAAAQRQQQFHTYNRTAAAVQCYCLVCLRLAIAPPAGQMLTIDNAPNGRRPRRRKCANTHAHRTHCMRFLVCAFAPYVLCSNSVS